MLGEQNKGLRMTTASVLGIKDTFFQLFSTTADTNAWGVLESFYLGGMAVGTGGAQPLTFYTNRARAMTILNGGNVGIGTTNPSSKLTVIGSGDFSTDGTATTTISSGISYFAGGFIASASSTILGNFTIEGDATTTGNFAAGGTLFVDQSTGYVGIGTPTPSGKLHVYGDSQVSYGVYDTPLRVQGDSYTYLELVGAGQQAGLLLNREGSTGWLAGLNSSGYFRIADLATIDQTGLTNAKDGSEGLTIDTNGNVSITGDLYVSGNAPGMAIYGDGSDGDITISTTTSLSRDMFYNNLTVDNGVTLNPNGYRIFVKGTLTNNGTIARDGNNGENSPQADYIASGGAALSSGSLGGSGAGGKSDSSSPAFTVVGGGGGSGGGIILIVAKTINNSAGIISANGGNGGNGSGDKYSTAGGTGGSATVAASEGNFRALPLAILLHTRTGTILLGGGGGGAGGGGYSVTGGEAGNLGGAGGKGGNNTGTANAGGGGGGGGAIVLIYNTAIWGTERALGGAAGLNGNVLAEAGSAGTVIKIANQ